MAFDPRTKEERKLFPFWTLIVIAGCAALWVFGAKIYQESMAAYQSYAAITQNVAQNTYYPGVTVDGVELGGMTREEAGALFGSRQQETSSAFSLVVQAGERKWRITSDEVPMTFDAQTVLDEAYNIGRYGTLEERLAAIDDAKTNGAAFTTGFSYDRTAIDRLVEIIADSLEYDATDATLAAFDVQTRTFTFSEAKPGYRVNRTALQEDILAALDEGAYDRVIVPKGEQVEPTITKSQLVGQFGLISSFTTTTTKDKDRNNNIEISAAALNGRMVKPGDTMSFNDCT
ncbi:MAG: peptidoglycan binding domain-containing protein, partial [Christensenellales bacterium]|nr:peptidoglycan binding domain-containing protein [Christensenellales bacterium]